MAYLKKQIRLAAKQTARKHKTEETMELGVPLAAGNTAALYVDGDRIIKVFNERMPDGEAKREAQKQSFAYACGLAVPKVFEITQIGGRQAIIMEYVAGKTLGALMQEAPENATELLALSVEIQTGMHQKTVEEDALEPMHEKLARQIQQAGSLKAAWREALLARLYKLPVQNKLCHGDFHVFNLICTEGRTVIIDWADASAGTPYADACRTYLLYAGNSKELAEAYLELYCGRSGAKREDVLKWMPIVAGARLSENVAASEKDRLLNIVEETVF